MNAEDREFLELAAKAAGLKLYWAPVAPHPGAREIPAVEGKDWNPLTDDGDALRLALSLVISIIFMEDSDSVGAEHSEQGVMKIEAMDDFGTRRAIVRAAAEIGRAMP